MHTTTYGYKVPDNNDRGPVVFPAIVDDINQLDAHDHDGVNSAPLSPQAILPLSQVLLAGSWVLVAGGLYVQNVTVPGGISYDNVFTSFRDPSGNILLLTQNKTGAFTYDVFINDNTINVTAKYI